MTPAQFNADIAALGDVPEIVVRINSGGGDVFAANAIYTRLKDHKARITVKIDGWAASAATIIAMAGDTIQIPKNGVFMIHDPAMTVWDTFRAEDFIKMADELKVIKQSIVNAYSTKTKRSPEDIEQLMSAETWWTGDTAVENGFCDELLFEESSTVVENASRIIVNTVPIDVSMFKTVPKTLYSAAVSANATAKSNNYNNKEEETMASQTATQQSQSAPTNQITTVDALKAAYPDLCASIENAATNAERERIKAIENLAAGKYKEITDAAKFEKPITAQEMAVQIVKAQNEQGGNYINARNDDVSDSGVNGVSGISTEAGANDNTSVYDKAIDKLFPED